MENQTQSQSEKYKLFLPISIIIASVIISGTVLYSSNKKNTVYVNQNQPNNQPDNQPSGPVKVSIDDDAVLGDKNAPITLIEFSDFQCPFCRSFVKQTLPQIKEEYINTGKVKFVYRDFPLSFHPESVPSAESSECAGDQGKFWEMHDVIFDEQEKQGQGTIQFTNDDIKKWAAKIGLDTAKFNQCFDSGKYKQEVQKDIADGSAAGVSGTPAFFIGQSSDDWMINGILVSGAQPFSAFKVIIDKELEKLNQ